MRKEYLFGCDCHGFHFLRFDWDPEHPELNAEGYLAIGGDFWHSFPERFKVAWKIFRGRHVSEMEVIMDAAKAEKLKRALELYLADVRQQ